jgi:hypothetical protein
LKYPRTSIDGGGIDLRVIFILMQAVATTKFMFPDGVEPIVIIAVIVRNHFFAGWGIWNTEIRARR